MKQEVISLDANLAVSKYRQIINSVTQAISRGALKPGDRIPSINQICHQWDLSRDTVINAYNELKTRGIISSAPGKGYYIESTNVQVIHNVFLLFDEFNSFKEDLYNAFLEHLEGGSQVDIYFHHFNRKLFNNLLNECKGKYTTYVVMPAKFQGTLEILGSLNGRVIILDQLPEELKGRFAAVYQNFEKDTYQALMSGRKLSEKYNSFTMVYPGGKEPEGQVSGFLGFCRDTGITHQVISSLEGINIQPGEAYLVIADRDLVWLVKEAKAKGLCLGKDLGIISYNDTVLKEIVGDGITTISTDFKEMGHTLARLVSGKDNNEIQNISLLNVRSSF